MKRKRGKDKKNKKLFRCSSNNKMSQEAVESQVLYVVLCVVKTCMFTYLFKDTVGDKHVTEKKMV